MSRVLAIPPRRGGLRFRDADLSYPAVRASLGGAWVERVWLHAEAEMELDAAPRTLALLVDEEGRLKGLPQNILASMLYVPEPARGLIAGPALLVGVVRSGEEGEEFGDLPPRIDGGRVVAAAQTIARRALMVSRMGEP